MSKKFEISLPCFITVQKGLFGYYICLFDQDGPLGRVEDFDYESYEEA